MDITTFTISKQIWNIWGGKIKTLKAKQYKKRTSKKHQKYSTKSKAAAVSTKRQITVIPNQTQPRKLSIVMPLAQSSSVCDTTSQFAAVV
eukprot:UN02063